MAEYIERNAAVCVSDYAADVHPYDKDPEKPETFSDYNQGWHDACDYIRDKLEAAPTAEVEPVRHGRWEWDTGDVYACSLCGEKSHVKEVMEQPAWGYCPACGAKMDGGDDK